MTRNKVNFEWQPFSNKQLKIMTWWNDNSPMKNKDGIIADGAVRSGKTSSMAPSFVIWAMTKFNECDFAICGKTIGSLNRNVLNLLKKQLNSLKYKFEHKRKDNLLIVSKNKKTNYFYLFGGKDESSQDLIQGMTLAGIFFDEVVLMPKSFVEQGIARLSVDGSKFWFNDNPGNPNHWFKTEWIDKIQEKNILYLHFTMDDNLTLSKEVKDRYRKMFVGVFFQRFILGLWVLAEGIIYSNFDKEKHTVELKDIPSRFDYFYVTSDYGITNPQVFLLCGIKYIKDKPHVWILDEYYNVGKKKNKNGQDEKITKTDDLFLKDYKDFTEGIDVKKTIIDPSATSLINLFKQNNIQVKEADNSVIDGINVVLNWLDEERIHIVAEKCPNIIKEFNSYIWDTKAQERGEDKPVKENDHALDALRYLLQTLYPVKKKGVYFANPIQPISRRRGI